MIQKLRFRLPQIPFLNSFMRFYSFTEKKKIINQFNFKYIGGCIIEAVTARCGRSGLSYRPKILFDNVLSLVRSQWSVKVINSKTFLPLTSC